MSSMTNPNPWTPYNSYTDCSQEICNIYCPQWCYLILPPPPPPPPPPSFFNNEEHSSSSSPLLIALIGILATAFILVSYYTLISKYCHRHRQNFSSSSNAASGDGLIESVIKSITVYKYRKGDGFVNGSDCSVCLSEFEENESLRLLPKCNHAFHLPCIDTWFKSHSNCPLCRAFVTGGNPTTTDSVTVYQIATESGGGISNMADFQHQSGESVVVIADLEIGSRNVNGRSPEEQGERKDDEDPAPIRRSVSLNSAGTVVVVSIVEDGEFSGVRTSQQRRDEDEHGDGKTPTLTAANQISGGVSSFLVRSTVAMKRSVSTGRFIFSSKKLPN